MKTFTLANDNLVLEFNRANGALVRCSSVRTGWKILDRPSLGLSFRLLLPLSEERRDNPVHGESQALAALDVAADGRGATLTWEGVTSEHGGRHAITLTLKVTLDDRQAVFAMTVENRSGFVVENVFCPYLGDVAHPPDESWFKAFIYTYASAQEWRLWPQYDSLRGGAGVDHPTQLHNWHPFVGAPMSPFFLLRGEKQGLYAGVDRASSELVAWYTELRPGYGSSIDSRPPEELIISGKEVCTRFAAVHVPYIQPGETCALMPIAIEPYQGGWQHGADIYKRWRNTWFHFPQLPAWTTEPHAWQQIHINSPEDELRLRFIDLPKIGEDCAKHGVRAIQLVGWNEGGQDRGNPSHTPDSRLGTWEELKEAIRKIQAKGVKLILFSKFTWADRSTEWFRQDLKRLAIKDPYGDYYLYPGYQYQTATQLLDINTKRLIPMCFLSQEYLDLCEQEFKKMVDLGADGILFDECLHHGQAFFCFDLQHGHRYGAMVYANDCKLIRNFSKIADKICPDFLFAGEACYDWELEVYHLSYHRSEAKQHIPLSRYLQPQVQFMTAVTGFNDRNMINQCLMYRYIISYEPFNFKGRLDDFPLTLAYGKQMDALRTELRDYFWDGEFRDTLGAAVTCGGKTHHPYAVFINAKKGKMGLVICNYDEHLPVTVATAVEQGEAFSRYRLVDDPDWKPVEDGITLPPQSAAVVI